MSDPPQQQQHNAHSRRDGIAHPQQLNTTAAHTLPRVPGSSLNEFGLQDSPLSTTSISSSSFAGRRPLPSQPPQPHLPPNPYLAYRAPAHQPSAAGPSSPGPGDGGASARTPGGGSIGSIGRRALPTPPSRPTDSTGTPIPPPRGARALPQPPGRTASSSSSFSPFPEGDPPPPPPRPPAEYTLGYRPSPPPRTGGSKPLPPQPGLRSSSSTASSSLGHSSPVDHVSRQDPSLASSSNAPSRASSSSYSHAHSTDSESIPSGLVTRNTTQSTHASDAISTPSKSSAAPHRPPSLAIDNSQADEWMPILERFGDLDSGSGGGAAGEEDESTLHAQPPAVLTNGRGTPTQRDWFAQHTHGQGQPTGLTPGYLDAPGAEGVQRRDRAASAATIQALGEGEAVVTPRGEGRYEREGGVFGAGAAVGEGAQHNQAQGAGGEDDAYAAVSFPIAHASPPIVTPPPDSASGTPEGYYPSDTDRDPSSLHRESSARSYDTTRSAASRAISFAQDPASGSGNGGGTARTPHAPHRQSSSTSSLHPHSIASYHRRRSSDLSPSWGQQTQQPAHWVERKLMIHESHRDGEMGDDESMMLGPSGGVGGWEEGDEGDGWEEEEEEEGDVDERQFFQPAFLSEMALQLRDKVAKGRHIKAGIAWVGSFTGKDIVTSIQGLLPSYTRENNADRRFALILAQSLQNQLWFVEVDWDIKPLRDSSDDVFRFMGEMEGMGSGGDALTTELPKGLMTMATRCYSPSCTGNSKCYSPRCPYKTHPDVFLPRKDLTPIATPASASGASGSGSAGALRHGDWREDVDPIILRDLDPKQVARQNIIRQAIASEVAYDVDLTAMETLFIKGLRDASPPIIPDPVRREQFISEVFNNALELREACRALIEEFTIRVREQPIVLSVGDLFLNAAVEFRDIYPEYTGRLPQAEAALTRETDENPDFRFFAERVVRENDRRRDIKYLITRPSTQLQRYPAVLEGILNSTAEDDPDHEFLFQALQSIQNISSLSQLKLFHASKGRGPAGKLQWFDLVSEEVRATMEKKEQKRQMHIWELIQGEMEYVADLETIQTLFVNGLVNSDPPVIDRNRFDVFIHEAFHNFRSLLEVHSTLLRNLQRRQLEQHPNFGMVSDLVLDAALSWQGAYMEYVTHYPIAKAKVKEEEKRNPKFAEFLKACLKDPASNRQDIYHFINRPIPRLLRYNLLLSDILRCLKETGPPDHEDIEQLPQVMEIITELGKATQKGVAVNESKVELWGFQHTLDGSRFGPRMVKDLNLANQNRELIHKGKVFRQPEGSIGGSWAELIVLLFDHYLVITKPERSRSSKKEHRQVRYIINRRPIPLELLSLGRFNEAPRQRNTGRLFGVGGGGSHDPSGDTNDATPADKDNKTVYPFSISFIGQGQLGGSYTLWADSVAARDEWKEKLMHAKVLRTEVNDAEKVFEMKPISVDTFFMPPNYAVSRAKEDQFTGRVTCSCPFITQDGRKLVAVGCQDGVWIGLRGEPRSLQKVLHVKAVTNIAVLEEFSMFLVLADKALVAYQLEALVPSAGQKAIRTPPEKISMPKEEVAMFMVGRLDGRTLVVTMQKQATQSVFKVLEPVLNRNMDDTARQRRPFGFLGKTSEWFRPYKVFYLPAEVYALHFLKQKLAIVCSRGFEIMDLTDIRGGSIPQFDPAKVREKPMLTELENKCKTGRSLGMFRSTETEFLLCYDTFGIYINRHGEPNRDCRAIEWEGRPDSVAFHPPYLLLISAPFIEIRHIDTARLLHIYTGSDIRLTWDGSGGQKHPVSVNPDKHGYGQETGIQEPQIHICQRDPDQKPAGRGAQPIGQVVYELCPTLLLNNPLMNPFNTHDSNYLPPPPLTSHITPQIRQARPPSIMTTNSNEMSPNPNGYPSNAYPNASYLSFPNIAGQNYQRESSYSRDGGYGNAPAPSPGLAPRDSYGHFPGPAHRESTYSFQESFQESARDSTADGGYGYGGPTQAQGYGQGQGQAYAGQQYAGSGGASVQRAGSGGSGVYGSPYPSQGYPTQVQGQAQGSTLQQVQTQGMDQQQRGGYTNGAIRAWAGQQAQQGGYGGDRYGGYDGHNGQ
ncbi:hypothetical protein IAT38_004812 [Cryptococcus sp. DSM 104549]